MTDFSARDILYEDNHLLVVNKHAGQLVQADTAGTLGLEDAIKAFIRRRDSKPGDVFLGVVHRIDRPVSGAVVFAKTGKALVRLNEMIRQGQIDKRYWAITESLLPADEGSLTHHITRDGKTNRSHAHSSPQPKKDSKEARLDYRMLAGSTNYYLYEVRLHTGRHHQIRAQFSREGAPIRGDLKYGAKRSLPTVGVKVEKTVAAGDKGATAAKTSVGEGGGIRYGGVKYGAARSNPDGGISLHSRRVSFTHPVRKEPLTIVAPVPEDDNLWKYFATAADATAE